MRQDEMIRYDQTVELGIATPEEINLVRCIVSGSWKEVLNDICYARTGYQCIEDMIEAEDEE